jgi:hypothetical protein
MRADRPDAEKIGRDLLHPPYAALVSTGAARVTQMLEIVRHAVGQDDTPITPMMSARARGTAPCAWSTVSCMVSSFRFGGWMRSRPRRAHSRLGGAAVVLTGNWVLVGASERTLAGATARVG